MQKRKLSSRHRSKLNSLQSFFLSSIPSLPSLPFSLSRKTTKSSEGDIQDIHISSDLDVESCSLSLPSSLFTPKTTVKNERLSLDNSINGDVTHKTNKSFAPVNSKPNTKSQRHD